LRRKILRRYAVAHPPVSCYHATMIRTIDLVLASGSPRRRELLGYFGIPFRILATDAEEEAHAPDSIVALLPQVAVPLQDHPVLRAWRKAHAILNDVAAGVILAADTIVVLDQTVLNKPSDPIHACQMLRQLSGREHIVYTGLALIDTRVSPEPQFDLVESRVALAELSDQQISAYVATGEPLDKAGSYGIQGLGGMLVQAVTGSYTNVVGLPVVAVHRLLTNTGVALTSEPTTIYTRWLSDQGKEPLPWPPTLP
jgi:septum formation protein